MNQHDTPAKVASTDGLGPLYPERDHMAQGKHYLRHVDGMTSEGLHSKSRIAGELAARDIEIERLRATLAAIAKHSASTLRTNSNDRGDWAEDVAFMGKLARGH